jgi:hypothetical protein
MGQIREDELALELLKVLNNREWVVVVVQKCLPFLIRSRATEAAGMVLKGPPMDKQNVTIRDLNAAS